MKSESFWRAWVDFFFPAKCLFCGALQGKGVPGQPCSRCLEKIKFFSSPLCPRCGLGFLAAPGEDHLCGDCITVDRYFHLARSLGPYEGLIQEAIYRFKYHGASRLALPLGHLLAKYRDPALPLGEFDLILPVPLHPQRLRHRGFNQSLLLARRISRWHSIPLDFTTLRRVRRTQPQTQLSGPERQKNIHGAFAVETRGGKKIAGKKILLIDDVFTTGATVQECSKVLLNAGAGQVDVLTLARVQ